MASVRKTKPRIASLLAPLWLAGCLLLGAWFVAKSGLSFDPSTANAVETVTPITQKDSLSTRPIEELRVGQRLPALNPDVAESDRCFATSVDPKNWRLVKLRAETRWEDGTVDIHNIETLQPQTWIASHKASVGAKVPIPLDLVEMGSPEDMKATVVAIEPCPPIEEGPGQVILTTVNHLNKFLFKLTVIDDSGKNEAIGVTGYHKFYSETRRDWISAKDLSQGESLGYLDRPVSVAKLERIPGTHRVYNLTVENEHVYYVSNLGALVHNMNCNFGKKSKVNRNKTNSGATQGGRKTALSGRSAEEAVSKSTGIPLNRGVGRQTVSGTGQGGFRIPDLKVFGPNSSLRIRGSIIEVKNVAKLSGTRQIRDLASQARSLNGRLEIFTNAKAPSRGHLARLIKEGIVVLRPIPLK